MSAPSRLRSAYFDGNYPIELPTQPALGKHGIQRALPMPPDTGPIQLALCNRRTTTCLYCTVPRISGRR
jgi:hypothetical protein